MNVCRCLRQHALSVGEHPDNREVLGKALQEFMITKVASKDYERLDTAGRESSTRGSLHVCAGFRETRSSSLPVRLFLNTQNRLPTKAAVSKNSERPPASHTVVSRCMWNRQKQV